VLRALRSLPLVRVTPLLGDSGGALRLHADADGTLAVLLSRANRTPERKIYAPRFPKAKGEGWWLVLAEADELLALKRVSIGRETRVELQLVAPAEPGEYAYTLYLVSDCYVGFDQQLDVRVLVE
jgi:hypothetical protein